MHFQSTERPEEDTHFVRAGDDYLAEQMAAANDPLDDVFGSDPNEATEELLTSGASHPSDINRLRTEHTTAGYREGVSVAKETSIQAGFDEGFSLGATIGLKAGQLLGMLEGIAEALRSEGGGASLGERGDDEAKAADKLLAEARGELSKGKVFSAQYWAPDGNWTYEVDEPKAGQEIVFSDVAAAHPVIRKWTEIVDGQLKRWRIDVSLLDDEAAARLEAVADDHVASSAVPSVAKPLDW